MAAPAFLKILVAGVVGVVGWALWSGPAKADPVPPPKPDPTPGPTPTPPIPSDVPGACVSSDALGAGWTVARVQSALTKLGVAALKVDGICGPLTKGAIVKFQKGSGISPTGTVDIATANAIDAALKAKGIKEGGYKPADYAAGCNAGNEDAGKSIAAGATVMRDTAGKGADYVAGYRACFMKVITDSGYQIDEDGNITLADGPPDGESWVIGDVL